MSTPVPALPEEPSEGQREALHALDPPASLAVTHTPNPSLALPATRRSARSQPPARSQKPRRNKATFLYRFYDADDVLLYVGITDNIGDRTSDHARASSWMDFAVRSTIERHKDRRGAEEIEVAVIRAEKPLFNLAHNDEPAAERRLVDYLIEHDRRDLLRATVSRG